jgi:dTDP-4-dehydrorhamnose 3,5-epimerase
MTLTSRPLPGLLLIEPQVFQDARGCFLETWNRARYKAHGLDADFVQDNLSLSRRGVLRGLHFQNPSPQGKLVQVVDGEVFDVAVDLRRRSSTFGRWDALVLSARTRRQFYVPPGFAHGFQVLSESALFHYKCTAPYSTGSELTLLWNDPALAIPWPITEPILSDKDRKGLLLREVPQERLFDM